MSKMSDVDFEKYLDEIINGMTQLHNRLLRIEKWMLRQEEDRKKRKKMFLITNTKQK